MTNIRCLSTNKNVNGNKEINKGEDFVEIPREFKGRYFYHFTHIDNIKSIVEMGGLLSTNLKNKYNIGHHDIANVNIQSRRSEMRVTVGPRGVVHDYVPFYFATINPMLLGLLNRKVVDQPYICFIAISIEKLVDEEVIFTDASANTVFAPNFFDNPEELNQLDWNLIDSMRWGERNETERHRRMAEVLVYEKVPLEWFECFIVFNPLCRNEIQKCYKQLGVSCPNISYEPFHNRHFFFTKFFFSGRENETLVTGPIQLKEKYLRAVDYIVDNREKGSSINTLFDDIDHALIEIERNFCVIPELAGIYELQTDNEVHQESVSRHTISVVNNVKETIFFDRIGEKWKSVTLLAAYLHDIGKGPREKWKNGIQRVYTDHPADAIPMVARILSEDVKKISYSEIRRICLLVAYHDLMGDIIGKGRAVNELLELDLNEKDLNMLAALAEADISALGVGWEYNIEEQLEELIEEVLR